MRYYAMHLVGVNLGHLHLMRQDLNLGYFD